MAKRLRCSEIRDLTQSELEEKLLSLKRQLFELRAKSIGGRVEKPHMFRQMRKDVARINTVITSLRSGQGVK
jgi:large subunit ribosomal protein L29